MPAIHGKVQRSKEDLEDKFQIFMCFFALLVYDLSEGFKACLESFWSVSKKLLKGGTIPFFPKLEFFLYLS